MCRQNKMKKTISEGESRGKNCILQATEYKILSGSHYKMDREKENFLTKVQRYHGYGATLVQVSRQWL